MLATSDFSNGPLTTDGYGGVFDFIDRVARGAYGCYDWVILPCLVHHIGSLLNSSLAYF